jgi:hypothetical protein
LSMPSRSRKPSLFRPATENLATCHVPFASKKGHAPPSSSNGHAS